MLREINLKADIETLHLHLVSGIYIIFIDNDTIGRNKKNNNIGSRNVSEYSGEKMQTADFQGISVCVNILIYFYNLLLK